MRAEHTRDYFSQGPDLLPVGIAHLGVGTSMVISAAVCAVGLAVTYAWAPETTDKSLTETGNTD